ncbi:MAG: prepilin peptidase [Deltaproteobacteria bacterium]|nr:prepilin peptidase [Deltaproteobacteria bacterium]MBI3295959.1 prepilin peptidase [Deltaproteobacteria bacterium]
MSDIAIWVLLIAGSISDLRSGKLPNNLTFPFIVAGLLYQAIAVGLPGLTQSGMAVGAAFAIFFPLFALGAFAAGDVKLLMAAAAWMSVPSVIRLGVLSILFGAAVGLIVMVASRGRNVAIASLKSHLKLSRATGGFRMPFAPAVFCAYVLTQIGELYAWW